MRIVNQRFLFGFKCLYKKGLQGHRDNKKHEIRFYLQISKNKGC